MSKNNIYSSNSKSTSENVLFRSLHLTLLFTPCAILYPIWKFQSIFSNDLWWITLFVNTLERAGPVYIKLGQWMSTRSDIFTPEICISLARLQQNTIPHSFQETYDLLDESIINQLEYIDHTPCGVGAIAQVHRARLKNQPFVDVAVKVLHPRVEAMVQTDLMFIQTFAKLAQFIIPGSRFLNITQEIDTFSKMMQTQTHLDIESDNLTKFTHNFRNFNNVNFPEPIINSNSVLVETFHHGISLQHIIQQKITPFNSRIADLGIRTIMKMILTDNFCHADMHPGNILVSFQKPIRSWIPWKKTEFMPCKVEIYDDFLSANIVQRAEILDQLYDQGYEPQLTLLDAGLVTQLSKIQFNNIYNIFAAGLNFDGNAVANLIINECKNPTAVREPLVVVETLQRMFNDLRLNGDGTLLLSQISSTQIVSRFAEMIRKHHIGLDGEYIGLYVSCMTVEGIGKSLNADLDLFEALSEYII